MCGELASLRRLLSTHNPLYAVSAALVFYGLRVSFRTDDVAHAAILLASLSAYVALLAVTAVFLRRIGALWEDVRMLALLVLLLLLGISVTFDRTLLADRRAGMICFLGGWLTAVAVCEGLFAGLRVHLPLGYRVPFHALLGLFFVYPLIAANHASQVDDRTLTWVLFLFPTSAAVLLLTTLPAALRGPVYVADNGTPWGWPLYPTTLFAVLTLGVVGRAYYLCYSFHAVPDGQSIFGWYFIAPLLTAVGLILLLAGRSTTTRVAALAVPAVVTYLAMFKPTYDPTYAEFLTRFSQFFGAGPTSVTLVIGVGFYLVAVARRVPCAAVCLFVFCCMAAATDRSIGVWAWQKTHAPFTAAALLAALVAVRRHDVRWAWAAVATTGIAAFAAAVDRRDAPVVFVTLHAAAAAALALGFVFFGAHRRRLWGVVGAIVVAFYTEALAGTGFGLFEHLRHAAKYYPSATIVLVAGIAMLFRERWIFSVLGALIAEWFGIVGWREYARLRRAYPGLDAIVLGMISFAAAVLVSLSKTVRPPDVGASKKSD